MLQIYRAHHCPCPNFFDAISVKLNSLLSKAKELDKLCIPTRYPNSLPDLTPSGIYTEEEASKAGIKIISYDRLITNTDAVDYYVTFDSFSVGKAFGQYLVDNAGMIAYTGFLMFEKGGVSVKPEEASVDPYERIESIDVSWH